MTHDDNKPADKPATKPADKQADKQADKPRSTEQRARKERVLHTRVPSMLEQELKELAKNLRVPVSNLVRTILQDALATAEALGRVAEGELRSAAEKIAEKRARLDAAALPDPEPEPEQDSDPLDGVLGFQQMMLAVTTQCTVCGVALHVGEPAYLGVRATPGPQIIIGPECLPGKKEND